MEKRYEVKIIEFTVEKEIRGKTWEQGAGETPQDYGYTPAIEKQVKVEREVFRQSVDDLDIASVIKAVNGLV